jgi:hypothetical protein
MLFEQTFSASSVKPPAGRVGFYGRVFLHFPNLYRFLLLLRKCLVLFARAWLKTLRMQGLRDPLQV